MIAAVLVIEELGFQALERKDAHLLFKVISHRYERGSTIIAINKSISMWPDILAGDEILATAILDRLLHHCHVVSIDGKTFGLKEKDLQPQGRGGESRKPMNPNRCGKADVPLVRERGYPLTTEVWRRSLWTVSHTIAPPPIRGFYAPSIVRTILPCRQQVEHLDSQLSS